MLPVFLRELFFSMRISGVILFICIWLAGCTFTSETKEPEISEFPPESNLPDAHLTSQIVNILDDYYVLKDALVNTDAANADKYARHIITSTNKLRTEFMADTVNKIVQNLIPGLDTIIAAAKSIISANDETCEKKRIYFQPLSDAMYGLLNAITLKNITVYRQYSANAMNGEGAYWLSRDMEIKNPYFGVKMLEDGEITDSLK